MDKLKESKKTKKPNTARIIRSGMALRMALLMSVAMSFLGNITSSRFDLIIFLITFAASFVLSLLIGIIVPMDKIGAAATKNMKQNSFGARCLESLISDAIYTPVISLVMTWLVRTCVPPVMSMQIQHAQMMIPGATKEEAMQKAEEAVAAIQFPPFFLMFIKSFGICFLAGFILILIFQPIFLKRMLYNIKNAPIGPEEARRRAEAKNGEPDPSMEIPENDKKDVEK
ncbi:MAG: hypothetical protein IK115_09580 [Lachnospiraceae bacterium]|nr:hypothetical protein [Lachnospiraceae bacterium]